MTSPLENLCGHGKPLSVEPPDDAEIAGLLRSGRARLTDACNQALSLESRFDLAYNAAHALCLAALRRQGYRPRNRYIVFQVLGSTASLPTAQWRFLDNCHQKRNAALYDGDYAEDEPLIAELIEVTKALQAAVLALGSVGSGTV